MFGFHLDVDWDNREVLSIDRFDIALIGLDWKID